MMFSKFSLCAILAIVIFNSVLQASGQSVFAGSSGLAFHSFHDNYVKLPAELGQKMGMEMTFEAWFKTPVANTRDETVWNSNVYGDPSVFGSPFNYTALNRIIVSRYNSTFPKGNPPNRVNDFCLQLNPEGNLVFFIGGGIGFGVFIITDFAIEAERWYHVAFTIANENGLPKEIKLYLDYEPLGSVDTTYERATTYEPGKRRRDLRSEAIYIGHYLNNDNLWPSGQYWLGEIDEVRFWDGARLKSEIIGGVPNFAYRSVNGYGKDTWIYSTDGLGADLVAAYNFNEVNPENPIAYDQGPYRFNGEIKTRNPALNTPKRVGSTLNGVIGYEYVIQTRPEIFQLWGTAGSSFQFSFNTFLNGHLYRYGGPDGVIIGGIQYPALGAEIFNGDTITDNQVVYVSNAVAGDTLARFFYFATLDGVASPNAEVRIVIDCCCAAGENVDFCGVCNGANATLDGCGVCDGTNACAGCDNVPYSGLKYDICGVCNGDNKTCTNILGCDGVIDSGMRYDKCGVCGGNNACVGCDNVPFGKIYDVCGVCGGNGQTCGTVGCDGVRVYSGSPAAYDKCGVCKGNGLSCAPGCDNVVGSMKTYDACGVCGGPFVGTCPAPGTYGCDAVVGSGKTYDLCGICDGPYKTGKCPYGCDGIIASGYVYDTCGVCVHPAQVKPKDACGVCGGDGKSCAGCDGIPNSNKTYDFCGDCGGTGIKCGFVGCDGVSIAVKFPPLRYDSCGVCGGHDECIPFGCDGIRGSGKQYDDCGVCDGINFCYGCDGIAFSGKKYDAFGRCDFNATAYGCDGKGNKYDACGVCNGKNLTCAGCDRVPNSGKKYDFCGVCGGNNGTCIGCDGFGGGKYDACGKCGGDGSTCGGCDLAGGKYDACGVCAGDNSTCTCVRYHGVKVEELEHMLVQYSVDQISWKIHQVMDTLLITLEVLEEYSGPADLGVMVKYFNEFCERCLVDYSKFLDRFIFDLRVSVGLEYYEHTFTEADPYFFEFPLDPNPIDQEMVNPIPHSF